MSLLEIENLSIRYGDQLVVDDFSLTVDRGESVGLVGESGSGKSQTALSVLGLLPPAATLTGSIRIDSKEVVGASEKELNKLRARRVAMVFQDPMQALNPYVRIGDQLRQVLFAHRIATGANADQRILDMLDRVGLPDPTRQFRAWPHQLSGGMRQRVLLAAALITGPDLLIADEPTTALDVTVQAQILDLLERLRDDTALLLITHDLGVVAHHCERVAVIDTGKLVESGPTRRLFDTPQSARMSALLSAAPRLDSELPPVAATGDTLLEVESASVVYQNHDADVPAVRDLSVTLRDGETLAIVGESGAGKSSLVRSILGLVPMRAGTVSFLGQSLAPDVRARARRERRELQLVFQDPVGSLNPQLVVGTSIAEPLEVHRPELDADGRRAAVLAMLTRVGLDESLVERYPHELSGGQAQRVAIARALILEPKVLVCDEAVAALDANVRNQILDLLADVQAQTGLAIIFISHDLAVVRGIAHRVLVMYLGRLVELASRDAIFTRPRHPYTRALIDAVPVPDPLADGPPQLLRGEVPSVTSPPSGCAFHPRCRYAIARCRVEVPQVRDVDGALVACHRATELDLGA